MKRVISLKYGICAALAALLAFPLPASSQTQSLSQVGVVLMHGKEGNPGGPLAGLAQSLQSAGATVTMPEMPWSERNIYSVSYDEAIAQIDNAVRALRAAGKKKIVVAGTSIGSNAAIGYAARKQGVDAVVALAPGHFPESPVFREKTEPSLKRARELVAKRDNAVRNDFDDLNQGRHLKVKATPATYLSFLNPEGPANYRRNAKMMRAVPLFMAVGTRDRVFGWAKENLFKPAAKHSASHYLEVNADHGGTPEAAKSEIVRWLAAL